MAEPAREPNFRRWRLEYEADCESWFHNEVSNVVLAAWASYPGVLQTSHAGPLSLTEQIAESVDATYSTKINGERVPLVVGEFKRNLIDMEAWQTGDLSSVEGQKKTLTRAPRVCALPPWTPSQ
jgi:hypothetical protein